MGVTVFKWELSPAVPGLLWASAGLYEPLFRHLRYGLKFRTLLNFDCLEAAQ